MAAFSAAASSPAGSSLAVHVERDGAEQDKTLDDLLVRHVDTQDRHAVVQHTDRQATDDRADDPADAAGDGGTADERGGDGVKFERQAVGGGSPG